jgi:hypothetical protein
MDEPRFDGRPAFSPPRPLDWEEIALKLAIIDPALYASFADFNSVPYMHEVPSWIPAFAAVQKALGIYPLNGREGDCLCAAVKKLLGK